MEKYPRQGRNRLETYSCQGMTNPVVSSILNEAKFKRKRTERDSARSQDCQNAYRSLDIWL